MQKDDLMKQKLVNELSHYKELLSGFAEKQKDLETKLEVKTSENEKLSASVKDKDEIISSLKQELLDKTRAKHQTEDQFEKDTHKMKMKIDYLTNKCFQLNCKLDRKDLTPEMNKQNVDVEMMAVFVDKKQKEY